MTVKVCVEVDCESPTPTGNGNGNGSDHPVTGYSQLVGDGTATSFTVVHNLNSLDVLHSVRNVVNGEIGITGPFVIILDENSVRVDFNSPPDPDEFSVLVLAVHI